MNKFRKKYFLEKFFMLVSTTLVTKEDNAMPLAWKLTLCIFILYNKLQPINRHLLERLRLRCRPSK